MFGYEILRKLSLSLQAPLFSQNNNPKNHQDLLKGLSDQSSCLLLRGPVRDFALTDEDSLYSANLSNETPLPLLTAADYHAVCQIRDPLDLIVSQYFSHGWIHGLNPSINAAIRNDIQTGAIRLYDYALMEFRGESGFGEVSILQKYRNLSRFSDALGEQCLILKYEDMVLNYQKWSRQISAFLNPLASVQNILDELRPNYKKFRRTGSVLGFWSKPKFWDNPLDYVEKEMKRQHIRSPLPGDHLSFLTPNEITSLRTLAEEAQASQRA
jgi:hypothetical protein